MEFRPQNHQKHIVFLNSFNSWHHFSGLKNLQKIYFCFVFQFFDDFQAIPESIFIKKLNETKLFSILEDLKNGAKS